MLKIPTLSLICFLIFTSCNTNSKQDKNLVITPDSIVDKIDNEELYSKHNFIELFVSYNDTIEKNMNFVSVSDIYKYDSDSISTTMPNPKHIEIKNRYRTILSDQYRKKLLEKTGISESDSLFAYYYTSNNLERFAIKDLTSMAVISPYVSPEDTNLSEYDYQLGFEFPARIKSKMYESILLFIGKNNPFAGIQFTAIKWTQIKYSDLPEHLLKYKNNSFKYYLYQTDNYKYYVINLNGDESFGNRILTIIDTNKNKLIDEIELGQGEGTSLAPLNGFVEDGIEQWEGKLLKDYPPVIFGFEYLSFGCESLFFIEDPVKRIYLNCDNRH